jgi:hypothetical protein
VFWNGSYLLDGAIDRDGYSKDTVTINARLTPPKGGAPVSIDIKGSRTNLASVVNDLANKVAQALKLTPGPAWKPADEADQYYDEARWALKWGLPKEAQDAAEACWALGKRTRETADVRVKTYNAQLPGSLAGEYLAEDYLGMSTEHISDKPDPNRFAPAIRELQLFQQGFREFLAEDTKPDANWESLAGDVLSATGVVLRMWHQFPEAWPGHENEVADLQALARETVQMINRHPAYHDFYAPLASIQLAWGRYWQVSPEAYIDLCREVARSNLVYELRKELRYTPIVWSRVNEERTVALHQQFLQELRTSANNQTRLQGFYLSCFGTKTGDEYRDRAFQFYQEVTNDAYFILDANQQEAIQQEVEHEVYFANSAQPFHDNGFPRAFANNGLLEYFTNDTKFDYAELGRFWMGTFRMTPGGFSPDQARRLSVALDDYKSRLAQRQIDHPFVYYPHFLDMAADAIKTALVSQTNAAPSATPPTLMASAPVPRPPGAPVPSPARSVANASQNAVTNILHASRFWSVPGTDDEKLRHLAALVNVGDGQVRRGRFWLPVSYFMGSIYLQKAFIYGVDLETFQTQTIALPIDTSGPEDAYRTGNSFEVIGDYLYFNFKNGIQRYSLLAQKWEDLPVPESGSLTAVGSRLFIFSKDSIHELNEDGKETMLLASTRRRPALNKLDQLGNYKSILAGPDDSLRAVVGYQVYELKKGAANWSQILDFHTFGLPDSSISYFSGGTVFKFSGNGQQTIWEKLLDNGTSSESMLTESASFGRRFGGPLARPLATNMPPLTTSWKHPRDIALRNAPFAFGEGNLWFLTGDLALHQEGTEIPVLKSNGWQGQLLEFKNGLPEASVLPICLDVTAGLVTAEQLWKIPGVLNNDGKSSEYHVGNVPFKLTPQGIVAGGNGFPGFWLISWDELKPHMEALAQSQQAAAKAKAELPEQHWAELLRKYHLDHREKFTPNEKEAMIDDPLFLELELPQIDTNHNGIIDPEELAFFDANQDGVLQTNELAGLNQTWSLLAAQLMNEIGVNENGALDPSQLPAYAETADESRLNLIRNLLSFGSGPMIRPGQGITSNVIVNLERAQTLTAIRNESARGPGAARGSRGPGGFGQPDIKSIVEDYWKKQRATSSPETTSATK